jgi:hypothetical protein
MENKVKFNVYGLDVIAIYSKFAIGKYYGILVAFEAHTENKKELIDFSIVDGSYQKPSERDEIFDVIAEGFAKSNFLEMMAIAKDKYAKNSDEDTAKFLNSLDVEGFIKDLKQRMSQ